MTDSPPDTLRIDWTLENLQTLMDVFNLTEGQAREIIAIESGQITGDQIAIED